MYLEVSEYNIDQRQIQKVIDILKKGGIGAIPTDTVYAFCCDLKNKKGLEKLAQLKGIQLKKANFSLIFPDLSSLSEYTRSVNKVVFKALNKNLPGPFTFILPASQEIPKLFSNKKKTVGIRIPANEITRLISMELGNPLVVTSVHDEDEILEYTTDPNEIFQRFEDKLDFVLDGGYGKNIASTVVNCEDGELEIIREGEEELL